MLQVLALVLALVPAREGAGTRTGRDASRNRGEGRDCRVLERQVCSEEWDARIIMTQSTSLPILD